MADQLTDRIAEVLRQHRYLPEGECSCGHDSVEADPDCWAYHQDRHHDPHVAEAVVAALELTEEWGNTWMGQGPAVNRSRVEARQAVDDFRAQFPDHDHHHVVVSRYVTPWAEVLGEDVGRG